VLKKVRETSWVVALLGPVMSSKMAAKMAAILDFTQNQNLFCITIQTIGQNKSKLKTSRTD